MAAGVGSGDRKSFARGWPDLLSLVRVTELSPTVTAVPGVSQRHLWWHHRVQQWKIQTGVGCFPLWAEKTREANYSLQFPAPH